MVGGSGSLNDAITNWLTAFIAQRTGCYGGRNEKGGHRECKGDGIMGIMNDITKGVSKAVYLVNVREA